MKSWIFRERESPTQDLAIQWSDFVWQGTANKAGTTM